MHPRTPADHWPGDGCAGQLSVTRTAPRTVNLQGEKVYFGSHFWKLRSTVSASPLPWACGEAVCHENTWRSRTTSPAWRARGRPHGPLTGHAPWPEALPVDPASRRPPGTKPLGHGPSGAFKIQTTATAKGTCKNAKAQAPSQTSSIEISRDVSRLGVSAKLLVGFGCSVRLVCQMSVLKINDQLGRLLKLANPNLFKLIWV